MIIEMERSGTFHGLEKIVETVLSHSETKCLLLLSCDANGLSPEIANPFLKDLAVPVFGGIFPSILYEKEKLDKGAIVIGLSVPVQVFVIGNLSDRQEDFTVQIENKTGALVPTDTIFAFVDGFSSRIGALLNSMFTIFGLESNYIGGGAGSLSMVSKPCLFTNEGLLQDCGVLAFLDIKSGIGVNHGWQPVDGPFRVTEAHNNVVVSLDWQPAWDVYSRAIQEHSDSPIVQERFFDTAKAYPFGIAKIGAERVVRDPVMVSNNGAITCVGEIPEGSFLDLLHGNEASLIAAAGKARQYGFEAFGLKRTAGVIFFIDCISRVLFLADRFTEEINAVCSRDLPLVGACSIGEIANSGKDFLEFYNKTAVVAIMERI